MKRTKFTFFKDTPLIDFQNTIHFKSDEERDDFFLNGNHYSTLSYEHEDFNFIRDRSSVKISERYTNMRGVNYCTFKSEFEDVRYYAYVINYEYLNTDHVTGKDTIRVDLLIDGIMTYTQGHTLETLRNINIQRQHLPMKQYNERLWELKNNDDILTTKTKAYFKSDRIVFRDFIVLIKSSVDLVSDFGTVDNPKIKTSSGSIFDKITSPLDLYACEFEDFQNLMNDLSDYPWISQNIKSLSLIPKIFMEGNLTKIKNFSSKDTLKGADYLYRVTGVNTNTKPLSDELRKMSHNMEETYKMFGLDPVQDKHLLRNEYTTTELYNFSGSQLFIDNGLLSEQRGLSYVTNMITGYHNEIRIYVDQYRVNDNLGYETGSYINDSLVFNEFDDIPMLIDNVGLAMSKTANQRALTESKLVSNRIKNVMNPNADLKDRFFDGASLISNLSPSNLFGKFKDEHEYYRQQKAEVADLALETPSITTQTTGNSFTIANNMFGIHFKYSKPSDSEMKKIKKYYKLFGYELNDHGSRLEDVHSMTICNYVQFEGSWNILLADVGIVEMMKAQFESGVRLWHNNGTANPMEQNVLNNKMRG